LSAAGDFAWARILGTNLRDLLTDDNGVVTALLPLSRYEDIDPSPNRYAALAVDAHDNAIVQYAPPAEIAGVAWVDRNGDGIRSDDEAPLAGITLRLYDSDGGTIGDDNDGQVWPTVVTASDGSFRFRSITPGLLYVRPDATLGYRPTIVDQGGNDDIDNDLSADTGRTELLHATSGETIANVGLGFVTTQPLARDDAYDVDEDTLLQVSAPGLVANDDHAVGAATTTVLRPPLHGALDVRSDGSFDYRPTANFNGSDSFSYVLNQADGAGISIVREQRLYDRSSGYTTDVLGAGVAISEDYAVAGAPGNRVSPTYGTATIYRWDGQTWSEDSKLSGYTYIENFGAAVDMSDDLMAITATAINSEVAGHVFVYRRAGDQWNLEATLAPSDPQANSGWGLSVSIQGDHLAVTASGAVYIFQRTAGVWSQQVKLIVPTPNSVGTHINSIALYGDTLAVGNTSYSQIAPGAGAVYVYALAGGAWSLKSTLTASDAAERDAFGSSVGLYQNTLVTGAPQAEPDTDNPGAVYVFEHTGDAWSQVARLKGDIRNNYGFGDAIDLVGDVLAVGSQGEPDGAVYVYQRGDGSWPRQARLVAGDPTRSAYLGLSVAVGPHSIFAGDIYDGFFNYYKGSVHFFEYLRGSVGNVSLTVRPVADAPAAKNDVYATGRNTPLSAAASGLPIAGQDAYVITLGSLFRLAGGAALRDVYTKLSYSSSYDTRGVAADPVDGKIYWADSVSNTIKRADADGRNAVTIVANAFSPQALTLDPIGRRIYWSSKSASGIWNANLDGSGVALLNSPFVGQPTGMAIDSAAGQLYFVNTDSIRRVNVDGSHPVDLVSGGINLAFGIALDLSEQKVYWTEANSRRIRRANLDGTAVETVIALPTPRSPMALAIDAESRKIYWSESGDTNPDYRILRSNLDGSAVEVLQVDGFNDATGIALLPKAADPTATLASSGSEWRYLANGSNQGDAWRVPAFNDSTWQSGFAELGFGDGNDGRPEVTQLPQGPNGNGYVTYYFRRDFTLDDVSRFKNLALELKRDDGAIVYLNGQEILRDNMPSGPVTSSTLALDAADDGADFHSYVLSTAALVQGRNVIAVEVHQASRTSSDLSFDLRLRGVPQTSPRGVLSNDADVDSNISASLVAGPYHGTLAFQANGTFIYTPEGGFEGVDQFTYRASDGTNESQPVLATINVGNANEPPVAARDYYLVRSGVVLSIPATAGVLANDSDGNGDPLTSVVSVAPQHGALTLAADGSFQYEPAAGFLGTDAFTYRVADGAGGLAGVTAFIEVFSRQDPINGIPIAQADEFTATSGDELNIAAPGVLANDYDPEGDSIVAMVVQPPLHGSLALNNDGSFTYIPRPGFEGDDAFSYRLSDGNTFSSPTTVAVTVSAPLPSGATFGQPAATIAATWSSGSIAGSTLPSESMGSGGDSTSTGGPSSPGDLNGDGWVNRGDVAVMIQQFGKSGFGLAADLNGNQSVGVADLVRLRNLMATPLSHASSAVVATVRPSATLQSRLSARHAPRSTDRARIAPAVADTVHALSAMSRSPATGLSRRAERASAASVKYLTAARSAGYDRAKPSS
jgi:sugar lactone lactonase YvrE